MRAISETVTKLTVEDKSLGGKLRLRYEVDSYGIRVQFRADEVFERAGPDSGADVIAWSEIRDYAKRLGITL